MKHLSQRVLVGLLGMAAFVLPTTSLRAADCTLKRMADLDMMAVDDAVIVPVGVNGTQHNFLVDTGGVYSQLYEDVAKQLGLKPQSLAQYLEIYQGGYQFKNGVTIQSFTIGNNEAKYFRVLIGPADQPAGPNRPDGVLSPDMLSLFDLDFDFANRKLNLFSPDHCDGKVVYWAPNYDEVPFQYSSNDNHIRFALELDGQTMTAMLDTGSTFSWLTPVGQRVLGIHSDTPGTETVPGQVKGYRHQFKTISLKGIAVSNPMLYLESNAAEEAFRRAHPEKQTNDPIYGYSLKQPQVILGLNVLRALHIYIDFKEKKLYVTAANAH
ncbi:MAG: retropepsin-like domain-containing protein [Proteobacteria bacterium]|nr:retropepsin-like domain-containing protein [Pseudomonadota bacterium]